MKQNGFDFAVMRCYQSVGHTDPNCVSTIKSAWAGGMAHVDAYLFPCTSCGNAASQMDATVNLLRSNGATFGMIWLDIEGPGTYWGSDQAANRAFFEDLVAAGKADGVTLGVYTSASQWVPIMGDYTGGASLPLWYAHYDGNPSFSDFSGFGGWTKPNIKQYRGDVTLCGTGVDYNWYP